MLGHCLHFSCVNAALSSLSDKEKVTAKYVYSIAPQLLKNEGESVCFCPPGGARGLQLCRGGELLHHADHPQLEPERKREESDPAEQEQGTGKTFYYF